MKKLVLSTLLCTLIGASAAQASESKLLTIVTSNDSMTQLMSMVLSNKAKEKGADVEVLFCGEAGKIVLKNSEETRFRPIDASPQMLLKKLIKAKAKVKICPIYLPNVGKTKKDLLEGVSIANPNKVAKKLLDKNVKILSY